MADRKLKAAMEEIKMIMEKYDIGGSIVLSSTDNCEYFFKLDPSWSIVNHNVNTGEVRVKALLKDYDNQEQQIKAIGDSANMVLGMRVVNQNISNYMTDIAGIFESKFNLDFKLGDLEPHIDNTPGAIN